jgi:hypothetical protein
MCAELVYVVAAAAGMQQDKDSANRINYVQMVIPEIVSGSHLHVCGTGVRGCCCCWHAARQRQCK